MGRPRADANAVPTRERILQAAETAFGSQGYVRARLEDIAADAGIRRPSLLYHFETKDLLYAAVVERLVQALRQDLEGVMDMSASFDESMLNIAGVFMAFCERRPAFASLVIRDLLDHRDTVYQTVQGVIVPVLDLVEAFVQQQDGDVVPEGLPVRQALLMFCVDTMVRTGAGPLQEPLWGVDHQGLALARQLFVR